MTPDNVITAFQQLGIHLTKKGNQGRGDCPFCGAINHFFAALERRERTDAGKHPVDPGYWDCKKCGEAGGVPSLLQKIHEIAFTDTTKNHYLALAKSRGIPLSIFKARQLAWHDPIEAWLIPVTNREGLIINFRIWTYDGKPYGLSGLPLGLYGLNTLKDEGPVYLCEGEWDGLALDWLFTKTNQQASVLSVPGASIFKPYWTRFLQGRDVYLCYDNDKAGMKGSIKALTILKESPKPPSHISILHWPADYKDGYDVRDYISERRLEPEACLDSFRDLFSKPTTTSNKVAVPKIEVSRFVDIFEHYDRVIQLTPRMRDALALTFATTISVRLPGDPIWLFVIGPAGCGKTTILRSLEGSVDWCEFRSQITPASLVSGVNDEFGNDPSLIPKLRNRALIFKDYTEVLSMPMQIQESIYGILRGAYDGRVDKQFAKTLRTYEDVYFSLVAGVTHAIHRDQRAALGERFLKFEMVPYADVINQDLVIGAAIEQLREDKSPHFETLKGAVNGFLSSRIPRLEEGRPPHVPLWVKERVIALAQIVSYLRAVVHRSGLERELSYRPVIEVGTRLAKQLVKLSMSLAIVFDEEEVTEECYRLIQQVALDSAIGWSLEVIQHINSSRHGASTSYLHQRMQLSKATILKRLEDLQELRAVEYYKAPNNTGNHGAHGHYWKLSDHLSDLWDRAGLGRVKSIKAPIRKGGRQS